MLAGGKRENTWIWLPGWIFIYASWQNKLAGAEIHAARLWLVIMLYNHFYYFSMNDLPLELILDPVSPSPHYFCTCLYYYENSRKPIALEANTLLVFALNTMFFLSSAHIFILSMLWSKEESPCATATGSDCFRHDIS